jgi:RNA polymerase sigma factor (sigma-70 family)
VPASAGRLNPATPRHFSKPDRRHPGTDGTARSRGRVGMQPDLVAGASYRHEGTGRRVNRTEEADFQGYVQARLERWRRTAYLMCQDWHTADDLVSIAVTKLYRHWSTARAAANIDAYAQRVLTRCWLDERRRPWRREQVQAEPLEHSFTPPDRIGDRRSLTELLGALAPRQRTVLILRFYLDHSVEETARILDVSEGTVKSQAARALETLRRLGGVELSANGGTSHG